MNKDRPEDIALAKLIHASGAGWSGRSVEEQNMVNELWYQMGDDRHHRANSYIMTAKAIRVLRLRPNYK